MHDLLLWRRLTQFEHKAPDFLEQLRELAQWRLRERLPYLGFLPALLRHFDPALRCAALGALAGANSVPALRLLVAALNDAAPEVRLAAVEALRASTRSEDDWPYFIHVLFHPDPVVRRAAVAAEKNFPPPLWYLLYLLPDDECVPTLLPQVQSLQPPHDALPLLLEYAQRGIVPRGFAAKLCAAIPWPHCWNALSQVHVRPPEVAGEVLDCVRWREGTTFLAAHEHRDPLDDFFDLFWEDDDADGVASAFFFTQLLPALLEDAEDARRRVVAALVMTALRRGAWLPQAAGVCALFFPYFLTSLWVPHDVRRDAVATLYRVGERCPRLTDSGVRCLLEADLCRQPSGLPDLWVIGGILHFFKCNPYEKLLDVYALTEIVQAFQEKPEDAAPFLCLKDESPKGRRFLIQHLCDQPFPRRARLLACLARAVTSDALDFLDSLDGRRACQVFDQLLFLGAAPAKPLSDNKLRQLADLLGRKIAAGQSALFLRLWLDRDTPEQEDLGLAILGRLASQYEPRLLLQAVRSLKGEPLRKFLHATVCCAGFPYELEIDLAREYAEHADEAVRAWAAPRLRPAAPVRGTRRKVHAPGGNGAVRFKLGLCAQLRDEPDPVEPDVETCLALLACHDPLAEVDAQFARFSTTEPLFVRQLDAAMIDVWQGERLLPLIGHVWLYRWDQHNESFAEEASRLWPDGWHAVLRHAATLTATLLRQRVWESVARRLEIWRWHDPMRLNASWAEAFGEVLVEELSAAQADVAARIFLLWHTTGEAAPLLAQLRGRILTRLHVIWIGVRELLQPWIDSSGLVVSPPAAPTVESTADSDRMERIHTADDLDFLADCTAAENRLLALQAARRLLALGEEGVQRLSDCFRRDPPVPALEVLSALVIPVWFAGPALAALRAFVRQPEAPPLARFFIGKALVEAGDDDLVPELLDAVARPGPAGWFQDGHRDWLWDVCSDRRQLALTWVTSPHPAAYLWAIYHLAVFDQPEDEVRQALLRFLDLGTERPRDARLRAANWLYGHGERQAILPLLVQGPFEAEPPYPNLLCEVQPHVVEAVATGFLLAGQGSQSEWMLCELLKADGVDPSAREECYGRMLLDGDARDVRREVRRLMRPSRSRAFKLRAVADSFAWGIRTCRELTGKLFSLEMLSGEKLGYTRFSSNKLYISPLPILRGDLHGRDVVRALILHEVGHHLYHRGPAAEAVWDESQRDGLHSLLNLTADEHLERNLRALDRSFGDRLKLLVAYAFQHNDRDYAVTTLLASLQGRAFEVLSRGQLGVSRRPGCVTVQNGRLLLAMERAGLSFPRFMRALRMGLGNRHHDPKVAEGLKLFKGKFRKSTMPQLLDIARKLREIFGQETDLLNSFDPESDLWLDEDDLLREGEDLSNDEVQSEIRRMLQGRGRRPREEGISSRTLNVGPDEEFSPLTEVVPIAHDPAQHAAYAERVARAAAQLRQYFRELGLSLEPQRFRVRGRSFDRTRVKAVVLRGDPRMLIARELKRYTDLFVGVVVDCSGSMDHAGNIEKAKLFGTMLAEAARHNPGIDVRLFGFTDSVIYDAGDANRCAVHGLEAGGGNNDAAGLWHAAQAARALRRRAKLLVMISDGLPTECSVAALRALVNRLTRRLKMCCAQVAVCPLEEVCFPNYIVLQEEDPAASVRAFGQVIARLVRKALGGS